MMEESHLVDFLNLVADYLKDGHVHPRTCDAEQGPKDKENSSSRVPLAYSVEEPEYAESADSYESYDSDESKDSDECKVSDEPLHSLEMVAEEISSCRACGLAATRKHTVPGEGSSRPLVMVIGEGPGADEDAAGRPFVGRAGQLLDKMLTSIGLFRYKNCYIANMVKCRPPGNRDPAPDEMSACFHFLERQILLLRPQLILCAGRVAAQYLLKTSKGINALRGGFVELKLNSAAYGMGEEITIPVLPTFHPSAVLRDESMKRPAWEDLKLLKSRLVLPGGE